MTTAQECFSAVQLTSIAAFAVRPVRRHRRRKRHLKGARRLTRRREPGHRQTTQNPAIGTVDVAANARSVIYRRHPRSPGGATGALVRGIGRRRPENCLTTAPATDELDTLALIRPSRSRCRRRCRPARAGPPTAVGVGVNTDPIESPPHAIVQTTTPATSACGHCPKRQPREQLRCRRLT